MNWWEGIEAHDASESIAFCHPIMSTDSRWWPMDGHGGSCAPFGFRVLPGGAWRVVSRHALEMAAGERKRGWQWRFCACPRRRPFRKAIPIMPWKLAVPNAYGILLLPCTLKKSYLQATREREREMGLIEWLLYCHYSSLTGGHIYIYTHSHWLATHLKTLETSSQSLIDVIRKVIYAPNAYPSI